MDVSKYVCMYVCMFVCMHGWMYVCLHTCMYVGTYVRMYVRTRYIYSVYNIYTVCVCMYIYIYLILNGYCYHQLCLTCIVFPFKSLVPFSVVIYTTIFCVPAISNMFCVCFVDLLSCNSTEPWKMTIIGHLLSVQQFSWQSVKKYHMIPSGNLT